MGLYLNEDGVLTPIAGRGDLTAIRSEMSYLGAKNLTPSKEISQTKSGVTFAVDSDGIITLNGTSNNTIFRSTISNNDAENIKIHLKKGTYTYSLCDTEITGVSLVVKDMGGQDILRTTSIRGANFTLSEDKDATIDWRVESGVTFSDTEFKAMIRLASDPDNTYVPYAMTNRELTEGSVYSTNETNTGKIWIDDKPIYRKVLHYAGVATKGVSTLIGSITGFADIITIEGTFRNNADDNCFPIGYTYSNFGTTVVQNMPFTLGNNGNLYASPYGFDISNINVIIEYTKTT